MQYRSKLPPFHGQPQGQRQQPSVTSTYSSQLSNGGWYKSMPFGGQQRGSPSVDPCLMQEVPVTTVDRLIEVQEVQVVERIVHVPHKVTRDKLVHVPKIEIIERRIPVPKIVYEEKIIEVPQVQYKEVLVEKLVPFPQIQMQYIHKEVPTPEHVEVPILQPTKAPVEQEIRRNIPVPVELITTHGYEMPQLKPIYRNVPVAIYVPRYIEYPVAAQLIASSDAARAQGAHNSGLAEATHDSDTGRTLPMGAQSMASLDRRSKAQAQYPPEYTVPQSVTAA